MRIAKRLYLLALIMVAYETPAATIDLAGGAENEDGLGFAVAVGDFNCDGFDDLAAGVPFEDLGALGGAGVVNIVYGGTGNGGQLGTAGNHYVQFGAGAQQSDQFGRVLAAGEFNSDGCDDLVVGLPLKNVSGNINAGQVMVLYGHLSGPGYMTRQIWHQDISGVFGGAEGGDRFGSSFAAGDFNNDGFGDLAIGIEGEDSREGGVYVLHGQSSGLTTTGALFFNQNVSGVADDAESGDEFGKALASGDFNGDGFDDLAVGVPFEALNNKQSVGAVHVFHGSINSLSASGSQLWYQDAIGGHNGYASEFFGASLAAGDFNRDGRDDLAIGVPSDREPDSSRIYGAVHVLYATSTGLSASGSLYRRADYPGLGVDDESSSFGEELAAGDFNGDGYVDLAIGAPYNDSRGMFSSGAVQMMYSSQDGFELTPFLQYIDQNIDEVEGGVESGDNFGRALAAGDFNNDGKADLAVGIPDEDYNSTTESGAVQVFYGELPLPSGLRLDNDQLFVQ